jgi:HAD superfamily hydrolase (TIGR01509 family)
MLSRLKQVYTRDEILTRCRPVFEKEYMLSRLRNEGYRMAVCSNSIGESLRMMVEQSGLEVYFEFLVSNEDVSRPKPNPEIYTTAMTRMGVRPTETIIVEDSCHGLEAARRSGAHVCQVSGFADVDYFKVRSAIDRIERRVKTATGQTGTAVAA